MKQSESETSSVPMKARQDEEAREPSWAWVEASVWNERMLAALANGVRGGQWFSLIDKVYRTTTLWAAWEKVHANAGAAGVDKQSVERFARRAPAYLLELENALKDGSYVPQPVKRIEIPKGNGKTRPLGIPTVKDRIVQTAVKFVIEPIFESDFLAMSYGFRPGRGCKDALREVDDLLKQGYTHVVDADLANYFDSIPHEALMARVRERISDGSVLRLLEGFVKQDILQGAKRWTPARGAPQGAVLSPLLANIYLHPLDVHLQRGGYRMVRYADDSVVLCRTAEEAQAALNAMQRWVQAHGLRLNPDKTHVGDCREPGQGFDFLGYRFEGGKRWVRRKSLQAMRERIRQKTLRTAGTSMKAMIDDLNPMLRGWFGYFKHAHRSTFPRMDGFIRRRLRAVLRKREKRPGQGRCHDDHKRWPNAYFAKLGLFTMTEAHALASQSR